VDGEFTQIGPKYDSGRGLIIPTFLAVLLRNLVDSRPESEWVFSARKGGRLLRGGNWYGDTWHAMVGGRAPRPARPHVTYLPGVRPVLGVEGMPPHGTRHSHKVWLDEDGHPKVAVEERMGHTLQGVEGTYSHTTLAMELKIAESLQGRWEQSVKPVFDREYGEYPEPKPPRKRSPRILPGRPGAADAGPG
jgi:integrase